jgi:hypothetical protein
MNRREELNIDKKRSRWCGLWGQKKCSRKTDQNCSACAVDTNLNRTTAAAPVVSHAVQFPGKKNHSTLRATRNLKQCCLQTGKRNDVARLMEHVTQKIRHRLLQHMVQEKGRGRWRKQPPFTAAHRSSWCRERGRHRRRRREENRGDERNWLPGSKIDLSKESTTVDLKNLSPLRVEIDPPRRSIVMDLKNPRSLIPC